MTRKIGFDLTFLKHLLSWTFGVATSVSWVLSLLACKNLWDICVIILPHQVLWKCPPSVSFIPPGVSSKENKLSIVPENVVYFLKGIYL